MMPGVEQKHLKLLSETKVFQKEIEAHFNFMPNLHRYIQVGFNV